MGKHNKPQRHVRSSVQLRVEELESRALLSAVWGAAWIGATGDPYPGGRVTLFTPNLDFFRELRTDNQGLFGFLDVPDGTYRLGMAGRGYDYQETQVTLKDSTAVEWFPLEPEAQPGRWSFIGDIAPEILGGTGTATLLANGTEVFICHDSIDPIIFNYVTGEKRFPPSSGRRAAGHATTLLNDGRVFLVGGGNGVGGGPGGADPRLLVQAKTYNPDTNTWTNLADMNVPRWYPSIVRLPYDQVLVFGGDTSQGRTNTAEIYDVATNTWTLVGNFRRAQDMPPSMLLYTGDVLKTWRDAELFNLGMYEWRDAAPWLQGRAGAPVGQHSDHVSVMLGDGRVVMLGIDPTNPDPSFTEIYDPWTDTWSLGSSPLAMRQRPEAMILPGGKVLAYGGEYTGTLPPPPGVVLGTAGQVRNVTRVTDLYDPATDSWRRLADLNRFIHYHSVAALLPDGRILDTAGAGTGGPFGMDQRVEAYEPPYLFRGVRPRIDAVSTTDLVAGQKFAMDVSFTSSATEVVLVGTRASTHWIDGGTNRYLSLDFQQFGSEVYATVPADQLQALSGWYLLFVMVDDIPSEAWIVRINDVGSGPGPGRHGHPGGYHHHQERYPAQYNVQVDDHPHPDGEEDHPADSMAGAVSRALTQAAVSPETVTSPNGPARQFSTVLDHPPAPPNTSSGLRESRGDRSVGVRRPASSSSPLTAEARRDAVVAVVFEETAPSWGFTFTRSNET